MKQFRSFYFAVCLIILSYTKSTQALPASEIFSIAAASGGCAMLSGLAITILCHKKHASLAIVGIGLSLEAATAITYALLQEKYNWPDSSSQIYSLNLIFFSLFDLVSFSFLIYHLCRYRPYQSAPIGGRAGGVKF